MVEMRMEKDQEGQINVALPSECNIYTINAVQEQISSTIKLCSKLTLDLASVEQVDACFFQLLHSASKSMANKNGEFLLINIPDDLVTLSEKIHAPLPSSETVNAPLPSPETINAQE